jgi:hypothetical protein
LNKYISVLEGGLILYIHLFKLVFTLPMSSQTFIPAMLILSKIVYHNHNLVMDPDVHGT